MNNPDYISFDFVDSISDYVKNRMLANNKYSKLKPSKCSLPVSDYYIFREKIMNEFCYNIVCQYGSLWIKKSVIKDVLSTYDDLIMSSNIITDETKDDVCIFINNQRRILIELHNL